ncbi:MAG: AtpZ/AtpI family protein [Desulfurivibrionaceae bacterium]|nr:AtpZ/AtpI family protein [Desulfobulbales bacterium]MDT8334657.1 AtpZ/AtpI family protein [Desulfurivibrionaceae bacterium]
MSGTRKEMIKMLADFSTIGMTVSFSIFIGVGFGYYLDTHVFAGRTKPWFTLIFLGFGVAAAFLNLYRMATRKEIGDGKK